jgi:hypothetical protein
LLLESTRAQEANTRLNSVGKLAHRPESNQKL